MGCVTAHSPEPMAANAPDIPLWQAARIGNIEAVKQHIAAGTDVNAKDESESTPLHSAAGRGHKEIVEVLIEKGADVNAKSKGETTPLHSAAMHDHKEIAELLIAKGADVNVKDENSHTPLDLAIIYKSSRNTMLAQLAHSEIANLLRKHGGKTAEELKTAGN